MTSPIKLGISACVIGEPVRYDGGHKRLSFVTDELARHFDFVPVCPEVAIGLGTPRPTLRLVETSGELRVLGSRDSRVDVTDQLTTLARDTAETLDEQISGYIVCAKSPSCGMERVPVYGDNGHSLGKRGVGAFTRELMARLPLLPVEENGRLNDPLLRENFVLRVTAYHRWQQLCREGLSAAGLQAFHRRHKFLLLAHHQQAYRQLGPLLANSDELDATAEEYIARFMAALARPATRSNHCNALMHMQGFLKKQLDSDERRAISDAIHRFREGLLPLLAPLTLLSLYLKKHHIHYLLDQYYLDPYPEDLKLRYGL